MAATIQKDKYEQPFESLLDKFVRESIELDNVEEDDIQTTKYDSGYIAPDGKFFPCGFIQHKTFSGKLVDYLEIDIDEIDFGKLAINTTDSEAVLDYLGFVKLSQSRLYFCQRITQKQLLSIFDYMINREVKKIEAGYNPFPSMMQQGERPQHGHFTYEELSHLFG